MFLKDRIKNYELILASSSPSRRELIGIMGLKPDLFISPNIDESIKKNEDALIYSKRVTRNKAEKVIADYPNAIIIAADTIAVCRGKILRKACDEDYARYCLQQLSGRRHTVYTTVCIGMGNIIKIKTVKTVVKLKRLEKTEIDHYVDSKEWLNKGGATCMQGLFSNFVQNINGCYFNIIGLPIHTTYNLLNSLL